MAWKWDAYSKHRLYIFVFSRKNCTELWLKFKQAFSGKEHCSTSFDDFLPFLESAYIPVPKDKVSILSLATQIFSMSLLSQWATPLTQHLWNTPACKGHITELGGRLPINKLLCSKEVGYPTIHLTSSPKVWPLKHLTIGKIQEHACSPIARQHTIMDIEFA